MRTFAELKQARDHARRVFCDPARAVFHLFFRWHDGNGMDYEGEDMIASMWGGKFTLWPAKQWPLSLPVVDGQPIVADAQTMRMDAWGMTRLGLGVWAVVPSINQPGSLHAYVIVTDVPEPAPWETKP